ncbi:ABC transporter permease [Nonomuraea sp. NPDC050153]|uniref:ABC transporter permease n=1 Tax=Nonomuraea sp. NPDC050153 TaxID=3364359 RepID=UPI0037969895
MRRPRSSSRAADLLRGCAGLCGLFAVAELLPLDPALLPPASVVLARAVALLTDLDFVAQAGATLMACTAGLLLTMALAIPAGVLLGALPRLESALRPLHEFARPIPSVALIPLALFVLPVTHEAKVALIVYTCSWPVLINTMYGIRDVDPLAKDTLRAFGFGRLAVLCRVSLPAAAPFIGTGVRVAASVSLIVAISVELVAGGSGIGAYLTAAGADGRNDTMIAGSIWVGLAGVTVNALLTAAERRVFHWRRT